MHDFWSNLLYLISRYVHIVCTTLLVGGTLFYEMVVPVAIGELKSEQQLLVFGRRGGCSGRSSGRPRQSSS